jgi:hypothetical protein
MAATAGGSASSAKRWCFAKKPDSKTTFSCILKAAQWIAFHRRLHV